MQIVDLMIPLLTDLSCEAQLTLILSIRERRRFVAKKERAAAPRRKKDPLANMTKEQLEKLLEVLTNGNCHYV